MAGHFVHETMSEIVLRIASGERCPDGSVEGAVCRTKFQNVVCRSLAVEPGILTGELQLAETHNAAPNEQIFDQIRFWLDSIPTMVANGVRVLLSIGIRASNSNYSVKTEEIVTWKSGDRTLRFVLDAVVRSSVHTQVFDWKTHSIDQEDVNQVRTYLRYLHASEQTPYSRLFGFAIDLRREEIIPVNIDPFRPTSNRPSTLTFSAQESGRNNSFAPKPHAQLCRRCPYYTICADRMS